MSLPMPLRGVVPPVCTPLTPDLEVDTASLTRLVDHLVEAGSTGLFVLGSTSEVAFLPDGHRRTVVETVVGHVAGQVPVLAGAIDMTTLRVAEHATAALRAGADAVVATAPFYARVNAAETERHFRELAARVEAPLVAYDLPVSVHTKLDAELVLRLAADGVLAGVKDSSGDEGGLRTVLVAARERLGDTGFSVLTGSEVAVDSHLAMGAHGTVPGLGNVDPAGYVRLCQLAEAGKWEEARAEQERLLALFGMVRAGDPARMGANAAGVGAFKAALRLLGVIEHATTAPPQTPLTTAEEAVVSEYLAAAGLR